MASRHIIFEEGDVEIPAPRRPPPAARRIPPGVPPANGQDPPEGWTPIRIQCRYAREADGNPCTLLLYRGPPSPPHHHWPDTSAVDPSERFRDGRRWSPEPLQVEGATRVVRLAGMLSLDELRDHGSSYYQEVLEELTEVARGFGDQLVKAVIPRPGPGAGPAVAGAGKVFLEFACLDHAIRCWEGMDRRWFGGRQILAGFYPEDMFAAGDYGYQGH